MSLLDSIPELTIPRIREGLLNKEFSATEIAEAAVAFAQRENPKTNAYLTFSPERALKTAARVDQFIAKGEYMGALAGVPLGVKDVIVTKDLRTTCGSKILENYIPPYDATAVIRLEDEGALLIGKLNCDEFAMGSSNENSAFGPVRNPKALDRVPGGSSGGSAAAVAQGTAVVTLGSDTGGSIRQPASFCGVVGVTPTYGRVSRYGLSAFASSLDHIGPFGKTVEDAAAVLRVMAGRDDLDSTSAFAPVDDYNDRMHHPVNGMKIGLPKEYFEGLNRETGDLIDAAIGQLRKLGCDVREISLPHTQYALSCYYIIANAEASSNLARYDGVRYTSRQTRGYLVWDVSQEPRRRLRSRGQTAHHARHLRFEPWLLRCLLPQGAACSRADRPRLHPSLRASRCHRNPRLALSGLQDWREGQRSSGHVSVGCLHPYRRLSRSALHERSVRRIHGRLASRITNLYPPLR